MKPKLMLLAFIATWMIFWSSAGPAYSQSTSAVDLSWTDNSTDETGFGIKRCTGTDACVPSTEIGKVGTNVTTFTDPESNLAPAMSYCYTVYAFNSGAISADSNKACVTTKALLTVIKAGTGTGIVTSSGNSINCGAVCSFLFSGNASVVLTAAPASGSVFGGWSGACTGTGTCAINMDAAKQVTATFNTIQAPLPPSNLTVQ